METYLGKIEKASFGVHDGQLGLHVTLSFDAMGVFLSDATHDYHTVEVTEYTKWTDESRDKFMVEMLKRVSKILADAKVSTVNQLVNIPVEVTSDKGLATSWRVLTEVL